MTSHQPICSTERLTRIMRDAIFYTLFFFYFWFVIKPELFYLGAGEIRYFPIFNTGWHFFQTALNSPGGLAAYLSAFFSHLFSISWAGPLIVTLQAIVLGHIISSFMKAAGAPAMLQARYVPALLLLICCSTYSFYFPSTFILTLSLFMVWVYVRLDFDNAGIRMAFFLTLSLITYAAAGGTWMLAAFLCAVYEAWHHRKWLFSIMYAGFILLIPFAGSYIYQVRAADAYWLHTPVSWIFQTYSRQQASFFLYSLYALPLLLLLILKIWTLFRHKLPQRFQSVCLIRNEYWRNIIGILFLILISAAIARLSFSKSTRAFFAVNHHAYYQNWKELIDAAKDNPNNRLIQASVNRALFHTGKIGHTPQILRHKPNSLILPATRKNQSILWYQADVFLDLGYINGAEHAVVECLEFYGEQPYLLKKLAVINMVKGNIGTAKIYLNALTKKLFHKDWANRHLQEIASDPQLKNSKEIQHLRSLMMKQNHTVNYQSIDALLLELLESNPKNRMAFEYLMACYLMTKNIQGLTRFMDELYQFYPGRLPVLYEEALFMAANDPSKKHLFKGKRLKISKTTAARFKEFMNVLRDFRQSGKKTIGEFPIKQKYNYFFYYTFFSQIH